MQNKPNFHNTKIIVNIFMTSTYENMSHWVNRKNKPNSNPIKANSKPIKPKTNPIQTQSKPISCNMKFDHLKCLKLKPIMLLSLRVPNKYSKQQKQFMEEKP